MRCDQRKCAVCRTKSYASNVTLIDWTTNHKFHIWYVAIFKLFSFRWLLSDCRCLASIFGFRCVPVGCKDVIPYLQVDWRVCDLFGFDIATCSWFTVDIRHRRRRYFSWLWVSKGTVVRRQASLHLPKIVSSLQITSHEVDNDVRLRSRTASKWKKKKNTPANTIHSIIHATSCLEPIDNWYCTRVREKEMEIHARALAITEM